MSIWDNLRIGADFGRRPPPFLALEVFERTAPTGVPNAGYAAARPAAAPRSVRVLAMDSEILLFDEPAAGLSSEERRDFAELLRMPRDRMGRTIILVEHDLALVWQIADRITVLDAGAMIAAGLPQAILDDARVRNPRRIFTGGATMLETRNLHAGYGRVPVLRDISLSGSGRRNPAGARAERCRKVDAAACVVGFIKPAAAPSVSTARSQRAHPGGTSAAGLRLILDGHRVFPN